MKNKSIIIISATLIIVAAIGFFMIWPTASSIWQSWQALSASQADLKKAEEKAQALADLKKNATQINNVAAIAGNYIPQSYDSSQLILELSTIAANNNLTVQQTSINQVTPASSPTPTPQAGSNSSVSNLKDISFSIQLSGAYPDFLNFLKAIETSSKLTIVTSINLQMDSASTTGGLTVQITGSSFYKPNVSVADTLENIKVSQNTINMFLNLKSYANPLNPAAQGFGRSNPFQGY